MRTTFERRIQNSDGLIQAWLRRRVRYEASLQLVSAILFGTVRMALPHPTRNARTIHPDEDSSPTGEGRRSMPPGPCTIGLTRAQLSRQYLRNLAGPFMQRVTGSFA